METIEFESSSIESEDGHSLNEEGSFLQENEKIESIEKKSKKWKVYFGF